MASEESKQMKRLMDAVKGRPLSQSLSYDVNTITRGHYNGGDKLSRVDRANVQVVIERMQSRGVTPAALLLSECQQRSLADRKNKGQGNK